MPDERKRRSRTIEDIIRVVQQRHFNLAGVDHEEWARRPRDREADIARGHREEFEAGVRAALAELKTSHTTFYSERPTAFPPQHTINATLSEIAVNGVPRSMFVDVFEDGPAYNAGILPGDLLLSVDLRGNIGGSLGFAALVSYFYSGREEIGFSLTPARLRSGYSVEDLPRVPMPRTRLEALARLAAFAVRDKSLMLLKAWIGCTAVPGRTFVLVNEWTSSGEMAAAFASEDGRATLIGRTTKGNVLGAIEFSG